VPSANASRIALPDAMHPVTPVSIAARPERPVTSRRGPRKWIEEIGWLLLFVLLFPFTILLVGSLIGLIVQAVLSLTS
jgi:hypothetical protein